MCGSMADIQYAAAEIRRGKKERRTNHSMKIYMVSLSHRATINNNNGGSLATIMSHVVRLEQLSFASFLFSFVIFANNSVTQERCVRLVTGKHL